MTDRLPAGFIGNREIGASSSNPITADKLQHLYKEVVNFGDAVTGQQRQVQVATRAKIGGTAGWAVAAADNLPYMGTLPASQSGSTLVVPIDGLPIGATITGFKINSQIESAGGTVTLDAALRAVTNVAAEPTDAAIDSITQVSVTADTASAAEKTGLTEVVTSGKSYYLLITGTTDASTDIILQHCEVYYTETVPVTKRVVLFVADKAGTLEEAGAGLFESGTNTDIDFDIQKGASTSMLTAAINVVHGTGDRTEVSGTPHSSDSAYAAGDVISAVMTVTSAVGASGPWVRATFKESGD